jgi:hypothetical protein
MTFDEIFQAYYTLYLMESDTPTSEDEEYTIALRLCNEAIRRWENYDGTKWRELYTTRVTSGDGSGQIQTGVVDYDCPDDFKEPGGHVKLYDSNGALQQQYRIIDVQDVQFEGQQSTYCYFTGDPGNGYTMHLNPVPTSNMNGWTIDYVYYKQATMLEAGEDATEVPMPYFCVYRMLANRFRGSRNPYYTTAIQEAEDALKTMLLQNNTGSWGNPWQVKDRSNAPFGV